MRRGRRIAMFDSGLGGLTVLERLRRVAPDADIVYAADTARVPYGDRALSQVAGFARGIIAHLMAHEPSIILIACGTSCSAFDALGYPDCEAPLLAVVDCGALAAAEATRNGKIGVVATAATTRSGVFDRKIRRALPEAEVLSLAAPKLVPLIESGAWETQELAEAVAASCQPLVSAGCDTVVLGCTHFPLVRKSFAGALPAAVAIVDPAVECARRAAEMLKDEPLGGGSLTFFVSGEIVPFVRHAAALGFLAKDVSRVDFSDQVKQAEHR